MSDSFERAQRSYDKMLAAGPPEPPTEDVTVGYEVALRWDQEVSILTEVLGGEATFAAEPVDDAYRVAKGSTLIEEAASYEEAEEIVHDLIRKHLRHFVDLDSAEITAERFEADEPDWDAITKDRKIEEDWA